MPTTATIGFEVKIKRLSFFTDHPFFINQSPGNQARRVRELARTTEIIRITRYSPAKIQDQTRLTTGQSVDFFVHDPFGEGQTTLPFAEEKA